MSDDHPYRTMRPGPLKHKRRPVPTMSTAPGMEIQNKWLLEWSAERRELEALEVQLAEAKQTIERQEGVIEEARRALIQCRAVIKLADEAPKAFDRAQANVTFGVIFDALEVIAGGPFASPRALDGRQGAGVNACELLMRLDEDPSQLDPLLALAREIDAQLAAAQSEGAGRLRELERVAAEKNAEWKRAENAEAATDAAVRIGNRYQEKLAAAQGQVRVLRTFVTPFSEGPCLAIRLAGDTRRNCGRCCSCRARLALLPPAPAKEGGG
jgi:hypothetical protein